MRLRRAGLLEVLEMLLSAALKHELLRRRQLQLLRHLLLQALTLLPPAGGGRILEWIWRVAATPRLLVRPALALVAKACERVLPSPTWHWDRRRRWCASGRGAGRVGAGAQTVASR